MAENKEYQVLVLFKCGNKSFASSKLFYNDYKIAHNCYMGRLEHYKDSLDSIDIEYGMSVTIELIEILNDDESITLKSHSYGKK